MIFKKSTYLKLFHILMLRVTLSTDKPYKKGFRDVGANSAKPKTLKTSDISTPTVSHFEQENAFKLGMHQIFKHENKLLIQF